MGLTVLLSAFIPGVTKSLGLMGPGVRGRVWRLNQLFSAESQLGLTLAHEIGHWILHTGQSYFRDRSLSAPDRSGEKPYYEIEADVFAAELLMPPRYLERVFLHIFGDVVDSGTPTAEIVASSSIGRHHARTRQDFVGLSRMDRARSIASLTTLGGHHFKSLASIFRVSTTAMAIQLLDNGLVI